MDEKDESQEKTPDHLKPGQTPADIYPNWIDEKNIELKPDDVAHFPNVLELLATVNAYLKTPVFVATSTSSEEERFGGKSGDWREDFSKVPWQGIEHLYGKADLYVRRLMLYYGRHVKPIEFSYDLNYPTKRTPYWEIIDAQVGYRGIEQFLPNYNNIRDLVVEALDWYYKNDASGGNIVEVLKRSLGEMNGDQFLTLLKENRRRIDFDRQIAALY